MSRQELEARGIKIVRQRGDEILGHCIFHDDNTPSFQANIRKRVFICFACNAKGTFQDLGIRGGTPKVYRNAFSNLLTSNGDGIIEQVFGLPSEYEPLSSKEGRFWEYLRDRKITWKATQSFRIGYCKTGAYADRIIIPMPIGFIARSIHSGRMAELMHGIPFRKYLFPLGLPTNRMLYNFQPESETLILVEGVMDAIKLATYGVDATAVLTAKMSQYQVDAICAQSKVQRIMICFDGDDAGKSGADLAAEELAGFFGRSKVYIVRLPDGKDPGNIKKRLFYEYYKRAQSLSESYSFLGV